MLSLSRRGFLAASAATAASLVLPARVRAQSARMSLTATSRTLDIRGRAATVWGLTDGTGRSGPITTYADATSLYVGGVSGNDTLEGGLGNDVLAGIQRLDIGLGFESGLAVVLLAIMLDRITETFGAPGPRRSVRARLGLQPGRDNAQ